MTALCLHCGTDCRLTDGKEIYPHRSDLHAKAIWKCDSCGAYVGCHPGGNKPLGHAADKETRSARMKLHNQMLDPLWKSAPKDVRHRSRHRVYAYLAEEMGLDREDTHTGMFCIEDCRRAWRALQGVTMADINYWREERKALVDEC